MSDDYRFQSEERKSILALMNKSDKVNDCPGLYFCARTPPFTCISTKHGESVPCSQCLYRMALYKCKTEGCNKLHSRPSAKAEKTPVSTPFNYFFGQCPFLSNQCASSIIHPPNVDRPVTVVDSLFQNPRNNL